MKTRIVTAAAALAAALLAGCGSDGSACSSRDADLAASAVTPSNCTAAAGSTVSIPVNLCPKCSDTRASCQAEFLNGVIEVAPVFFECEENRGCQLNPSCENNPATRRVNCQVSIPASASGSIPIIAATGRVGTLDVTQGSASCAFAANDAP